MADLKTRAHGVRKANQRDEIQHEAADDHIFKFIPSYIAPPLPPNNVDVSIKIHLFD